MSSISTIAPGVVLHQGEGWGGPVVVIATFRTSNRKTGDMVQSWILPAEMSPVEAVTKGLDSVVCGDCQFRSGGGCYVNVGQAPTAVWHAWRRGNYPAWDGNLDPFKGRLIRWGSYGEPALIPLRTVETINGVSAGATGYTHRWRDSPAYKHVLMASVDSPAEREEARALGWRTFRVRSADTPLMAREFACPASDEAGWRLTCEQCLACDGARDNPERATPAIAAHGRGRYKLPVV